VTFSAGLTHAIARRPWIAAIHATRGWVLSLALLAAAFALVPSEWPRWAYMWIIALAMYAGAKWLTWRRRRVTNVPAWQHLAYLLAWPGMDADAFLQPAPATTVERPRRGEWCFAIAKTALGFFLLIGGARWLAAVSPVLGAWAGVAGILFVLHFGTFHLLSCVWRHVGLVARPNMNWPVAATSVTDFWGTRWNTAYRDIIFRFVFRPCTRLWGVRAGTSFGFFISGLIHDAVISVPAGGGYGLPTLYFCLQCPALFMERSGWGRRVGLGSGVRGWLFAAAVVLLPAGLLFHGPFIHQVILPMLHDWRILP
jgi:alginate O-acetyltransferase complex protein AlgI